MRKRKLMALVLILILVLTITGCAAKEKEETSTLKLSFATCGVGGYYYPMGVAICNIITKETEGVVATAETSGCSVENVRLVNDGHSDLAFTNSFVAFQAYNGIDPFTTPQENVRTLFLSTVSVCQIVARKDANISTIYDLKGKKFSVGPPGSGTQMEAEILLQEFGLKDKVDIQYLSWAESAAALKDGLIDAAAISVGVPGAAITEVATTTDIVLVPLEEEYLSKVNKKFPFWKKYTIPAGVYPGVDYEVNTQAVMAATIIHKDISNSVVYEILEDLYANVDDVIEVAVQGKDITYENAVAMEPIPFHPGAIEYFRAVGIWNK